MDKKSHYFSKKEIFKTARFKGRNTKFGKDHSFEKIESYSTFKAQVPIREYEGLKHYVERMLDGEEDVLWQGKPLYFCKTSGTTSGTKYIPISKESMPYHLKGAKDALLSYIHETKKSDFLNGKTIFIQGSPELDFSKGTPIGRLSGIVAHHLPWYLKKKQYPYLQHQLHKRLGEKSRCYC